MTFESYVRSAKTIDAVERCLQRISEAAMKLGDDLDTRHPDATWAQWRGLGNVLRHRYQDIVDALIWRSVQEDLPKLRASAEQELRRIADPSSTAKPIYRLSDPLTGTTPEDIHQSCDWGPDKGREDVE